MFSFSSVIACPHCGKQQTQTLNSGQTQSVHCRQQFGGCNKGFRIQVGHDGAVQSVHKTGG